MEPVKWPAAPVSATYFFVSHPRWVRLLRRAHNALGHRLYAIERRTAVYTGVREAR